MAETNGKRSGGPPVLGIVSPCFNEEKVIRETGAKLCGLLKNLIAAEKVSPDSFVYFVDDGSFDGTWEIIAEMSRSEKLVRGLKLSRNFGNQNALLAGLTSVRERVDCAITIDADLQQDEGTIPEFIDRYMEGADVVFGIRKDRKTDSFLKKFTALFFYRMMTVLGAGVIENHSDYRLASRRALDVISEYKEVNLFLRGMFREIGFAESFVYFDVKERAEGKSRYSFGKLMSIALDGITSFSVAPLRLIAISGFIVFSVSLIMIGYGLYSKLVGRAVPGWTSTIIPIYCLGGLQLLSMGVIGEYIGKIYKETKSRPRYVKDKEIF